MCPLRSLLYAALDELAIALDELAAKLICACFESLGAVLVDDFGDDASPASQR